MGVLLARPTLSRRVCNGLLGDRREELRLAGAVPVAGWRDSGGLLSEVSRSFAYRAPRQTNLSSSGYGCANIDGQTCTMIATSTAVPTVTCDGSRSGDFAFLTVPDEEASITAFSLFAPMIQINWQSSDRPESEPTGESAGPTRTRTNDPFATAPRTQTVDTDGGSASETLDIDDDGQATAPSTLAATATGPPGQKEAASDSEGFGSSAKVGLAVAGASMVVVVLVCAMFYFWRRRKNQLEERELDRLYGMKHASGSASDLTSTQDIPGWYRGQRLMTPTADPFQQYPPGEPPIPASPYYRGYRS